VIGHSLRQLGGIVYAYHQYCYEARERMKQREREAQSERIMRQSRARRRRRVRLAALHLLIAARRSAASQRLEI
jgi:hypothetical protein